MSTDLQQAYDMLRYAAAHDTDQAYFVQQEIDQALQLITEQAAEEAAIANYAMQQYIAYNPQAASEDLKTEQERIYEYILSHPAEPIMAAREFYRTGEQLAAAMGIAVTDLAAILGIEIDQRIMSIQEDATEEAKHWWDYVIDFIKDSTPIDELVDVLSDLGGGIFDFSIFWKILEAVTQDIANRINGFLANALSIGEKEE